MTVGTMNTSEEQSDHRYFLVRDDTRLILLDFEEGNSEEISIIPFIDEELSHFTVLAETVSSGGPRHVRVWAVQHKPKSAVISFKTRRKIYELTMPYFLRY